MPTMAPGGISTTTGPDLPRSTFAKRVDGGVVRREPEALGVGEVVGDDQVVEIDAEVALGRDPDRLERNRRIGPQVGLHGALVVDLVEDLARGLLGRESLLEVQRADARLHAVGRRDAEDVSQPCSVPLGLARVINGLVVTQFPIALWRQ